MFMKTSEVQALIKLHSGVINFTDLGHLIVNGHWIILSWCGWTLKDTSAGEMLLMQQQQDESGIFFLGRFLKSKTNTQKHWVNN